MKRSRSGWKSRKEKKRPRAGIEHSRRAGELKGSDKCDPAPDSLNNSGAGLFCLLMLLALMGATVHHMLIAAEECKDESISRPGDDLLS
jgi:hypothetical protein